MGTFKIRGTYYMFNEHKKGRMSIFYQDILDACNSKETSLNKLFKKKNVMGNLIIRKKIIIIN